MNAELALPAHPSVFAPALAELARMLVLIAFAFAAAAKSRSPRAFAHDLQRSFAALNQAAALALAALILIAEWAIVVAIFSGGDAAHLGMLAALGVLAVFTALVVWSVVFDRGLVCRCFGGAVGHRMNAYDLLRNLLLMAAAALAWRYAPGGDALDALRAQSWPLGLATTSLAMIGVLLVTSLQPVAALLRVHAER
jgi:hypothetical protein